MLTSTPNSIASRRGAARVGAPAIVMFVLLLVALFYAYVAQDAEALVRRELDAAKAAEEPEQPENGSEAAGGDAERNDDSDAGA